MLLCFSFPPQVKNINENGVTYENGLCLEAEPGRCVQSGVLEFWDNTITEYDSQVGGNSTEPGDQMQLLEDINVEVFSDNSQVIQETIFYRPEYDESGNLVRAELAQVNYVFRSTSGESTFEDWVSTHFATRYRLFFLGCCCCCDCCRGRVISKSNRYRPTGKRIP